MMSLNKSNKESEEIQMEKANEYPCLVECSALDLIVNQKNVFHIQTSLSALDDLLKGGLQSKTVTEFCGPPGSGKTQFCQLLTASALLSHSERASNVLYFDTESALSPARLLEILVTRWPRQCASEEACCRLLARVHVVRVEGEVELRKTLDSLNDLISIYQPRLIIFDSVASHFRRATDLARRSSQLARIAGQLKKLAALHNIVVSLNLTKFTESFLAWKTEFLTANNICY